MFRPILFPYSDTPLHLQLAHALQTAIIDGVWQQGDKLPPSRDLAKQLAVSRSTVVDAYAWLVDAGVALAQQGSGTFVALQLTESDTISTPHMSPWGEQAVAVKTPVARANLELLKYDFRVGRAFPHHFPFPVWRKLLTRYLSTDDTLLARYGSAAGYLPLREALHAYLTKRRGLRCDVEQIVVVNGMQQAMDIVSRLWLRAGDRALVESPGYVAAYELIRAAGASLLAATVDEEGICLPSTDAGRFKLLFTTPNSQFPQGGTLSLARRIALLSWAEKRDALVIEDDYDSELRYAGAVPPSLHALDQSGRVIYIGTFSKLLFPALRLAYVVLPLHLVDPFLAAKRLIDRGSPTLTQAATADFINDGYFARHVRQLRALYGQRWHAMHQALAHHMPQLAYTISPTGQHVMLRLPNSMNERQLIHAASQQGVGVEGGAGYWLDRRPPPTILCGFTGISAEHIPDGIERLARLISITSNR